MENWLSVFGPLLQAGCLGPNDPAASPPYGSVYYRTDLLFITDKPHYCRVRKYFVKHSPHQNTLNVKCVDLNKMRSSCYAQSVLTVSRS